MMVQRQIELLAPARNAECAIAAIDHGADAVYMGAPQFGARAAAGNTIDDIARAASHAHIYGAKVYIALNTILRDEELAEAERMAWDLYRAGADALIVQDMGLLKLNLPPIALHASTQMHNCTAEQVALLQRQGFSQVVLARELQLQEIAAIHKACQVPLEVFVHGALCVSYSGRCYASAHCFGRSANRGECAQFCRLKFDLTDSEGHCIVQGKHLLSLKDMNRSAHLEELMDTGVTSFKIEGRLKDVTYVKNVTAYYRRCIDRILQRRKEYRRASAGQVTTTFEPRPEKSFNRGFTDYFLHGRTPDITSFDSPKSIGEEVGYVKQIHDRYLTVAGVVPFAAGDGLCFIDSRGQLSGFRVNRVDNNKIYPAEMPRLTLRTRLYRNLDKRFEDSLAHRSAERRIALWITLSECREGYVLGARDEDDTEVTLLLPAEKQEARTPQDECIRTNLGKLGGTPFVASEVSLDLQGDRFIPASKLGEWRRLMVERLLSARRMNYRRDTRRPVAPQNGDRPYQGQTLTYLYNVMNRKAEEVYRELGAEQVRPALEREEPQGAVLMTCRHCLRYSLGWCTRQGGTRPPYREPYYLVSGDGRRFRLVFDCAQCQMRIYADE